MYMINAASITGMAYSVSILSVIIVVAAITNQWFQEIKVDPLDVINRYFSEENRLHNWIDSCQESKDVKWRVWYAIKRQN